MFDRFDTCVYAVMETLATKSVTRNFVPSPVSLVHDSVYFFRRERGRDNHFPVFSEMKLVCRVQLDPICAMRDLLAHRLTSGPGRVDDLERDRKSQLLRVTIHDEATRCLKATGRDLHAGTRHDAAIDGVAQIHIAVTSAQRLQIAKSREAYHQVFLRVRERGQGAVLVGIA